MWSLGCILTEMVLGEPLFESTSEIEQLTKIFKFCGNLSEEVLE